MFVGGGRWAVLAPAECLLLTVSAGLGPAADAAGRSPARDAIAAVAAALDAVAAAVAVVAAALSAAADRWPAPGLGRPSSSAGRRLSAARTSCSRRGALRRCSQKRTNCRIRCRSSVGKCLPRRVGCLLQVMLRARGLAAIAGALARADRRRCRRIRPAARLPRSGCTGTATMRSVAVPERGGEVSGHLGDKSGEVLHAFGEGWAWVPKYGGEPRRLAPCAVKCERRPDRRCRRRRCPPRCCCRCPR